MRRGVLVVFISLLLLTVKDGGQLSSLDLAIHRYQYDLIRWEVGNLMDKWTTKLKEVLPWNSPPRRQDRIARVEDFFRLGQELRETEDKLSFPTIFSPEPLSEEQENSLAQRVGELRNKRTGMQAEVEETVESEVSAVLSTNGFSSRIGLIFPPVDTVFSDSPNVLVVSPRDRILRMKTTLLSATIPDQEKERVEALIRQEENRSALVEGTGGLAAYPSVVSDGLGLHDTLILVAHEWLHHWFFFRPLGQGFWSSPEMTTLNETAATVGGIEIGDEAYSAITGEQVNRIPLPPPSTPAPDTFDFNTEMRQTRLGAEELLAQGKIEEAERYMEERRQLFVSQGFQIRKINQAYFAFHGTYAGSAASISPIDDQLKELRDRSSSLKEFLKTVAEFHTYGEFLAYVEGRRSPAGS